MSSYVAVDLTVVEDESDIDHSITMLSFLRDAVERIPRFLSGTKVMVKCTLIEWLVSFKLLFETTI
jgi:hypothetical protein